MVEADKPVDGYNNSDKLAIALACLAGVMAIVLFLVEKTPFTVVGLLLLMVTLSVYPILHFVRRTNFRTAILACVTIGTLVFGWYVWPKSKLPNGQAKSSAQPSTPPSQMADVGANPNSGNSSVPSNPVKKHRPKSSNFQRRDAQAVSTSGSNSPAVGSITQGEGSALSINQQGGITAGTINFAPPQRTISQADKLKLISLLSQHPGKAVFGALGTDPASESFKFAQVLYDIFASSGWTTNAKTGMQIMPMMAQKPWSGVEVDFEGDPKDFPTPDYDRVPPDCLFVARALIAAHVKTVHIGPEPGVTKDHVLIIVGPNPDN